MPLFISINWASLVTKWVVIQKICSKMHGVSCTSTHHDVIDLINHETVKNTKHDYLKNEALLFYKIIGASCDTFSEVIIL